MALPLSNNAEGGTAGANVTAGNSGGLSGNAFDVVRGTNVPTFSAAQPAHGALGYLLVQSAAPALTSLDWDTSLGGNQTNVFGRYSVYVPALPAATQYASFVIFDLGGTGTCAVIAIADTGKLLLFDAVGQTNGATNVNIGSQFRVECHLICSATDGVVEVKLWNTLDSAGVPDDVITWTGRNTRASFSAVRHGFDGATLTSGFQMGLDDIYLTTAGYAGPVLTGRAPNAFQMRAWTRERLTKRRSGLLVPDHVIWLPRPAHIEFSA